MNKNLITIKEIAPGMVKIEPSIEGLLTIDRYLTIARDLLENGLNTDNEKLKSIDNPDMTDNLLLYQELNAKKESDIKGVVFSMYGKDYIVNMQNINKMYYEKPETTNPHAVAIREAIEELYK